MKENPSSRRLRLSSISIRLGLSLALDTLAILLLIGLVSAAAPGTTLANPPAPGDLDATFGVGGVVTTPIGPGHDIAYGVAIQEDGRLVAAGSAHSGSDNDFAVARYTVSGTLDTTFGTGGVVTTPIGTGSDYGRSVVIQPNGRIVVAGYALNGSDYDFALARYTVSGTPDTTFGTGGVVTTPIGPGRDRAYGVAIQEDGRIVVAGSAHNNANYDFALARYTVSGTLDTTFGIGGVVATPIGPGDDFAYGVAIQPDGRIVVAGYADGGSADDIALVRYTVSGTLDSSFGTGGVVTTPVGPGSSWSSWAQGVVIQPDGRIVAAGGADDGSGEMFAVMRYTVSGAPDGSFGTGGVVTTPIGPGSGWADGVAIQPDGRIVTVGGARSGSDDDFTLVRYTVSGTLDASFGTGGVVTTPIGPDYDWASGVAIQPDGKLVVAGNAHSGSDNDFALVRYCGAYSVYLPLVLRSS